MLPVSHDEETSVYSILLICFQISLYMKHDWKLLLPFRINESRTSLQNLSWFQLPVIRKQQLLEDELQLRREEDIGFPQTQSELYSYETEDCENKK